MPGIAADITTTYEYLAGAPISGVSATSTTPLVSRMTQTQMSFAYTYDPQTSNLTSVRHITGTSPADSDRYTYYIYDSIGQLIRVNDQTDTTAGSTGTTWVYEYDFGGNMLARKRYPYQTGTLSGTPVTTVYTYADANWKDKVTGIGGQAIQYDAIGNVVNDGEWTYTWQAGRQLARMDKSGTTIAYKYDHNGMRVSKTVNGVETKYIVNGSRIMHMTRGTDEMHFHYDGSGRVSMVDFGGEMFTYLHNLQGDIVGILDAGGNLVVEYSYDAWGRPTAAAGSMAGTLGALNPFRYRGYVWDEETGLYYLQSRYYRPEWGRFVSADNNLGSTAVLLGHNAFSYCTNAPVCMIDPDGHLGLLAAITSSAAALASAFEAAKWLFAGAIGWTIGTVGGKALSQDETKVSVLPATLESATEDAARQSEKGKYYFAHVNSANTLTVYLLPAMNLQQATLAVRSIRAWRWLSKLGSMGSMSDGTGVLLYEVDIGIYTPAEEDAMALYEMTPVAIRETKFGLSLAHVFRSNTEMHTPTVGEYYSHVHTEYRHEEGLNIWWGAPFVVQQ